MKNKPVLQHFMVLWIFEVRGLPLKIYGEFLVLPSAKVCPQNAERPV